MRRIALDRTVGVFELYIERPSQFSSSGYLECLVRSDAVLPMQNSWKAQSRTLLHKYM